MTNRSNMIPIAGRLHCVAEGNIGMGANEIYDDNLGITIDQLSTKNASTGTTGNYRYNGMGRVVIPKNIVDDVNTLTQDMFYKGEIGSRVPNTNTIFVIQYDYVLGEDVTVPANCVLEFDGGSISGENNINFNNCLLSGDVFITSDIEGNVKNAEIDIRWFGAKGDGVFDNSTILNKIFLWAENKNKVITIPSDSDFYRIGLVDVKANTYVKGTGGKLKVLDNYAVTDATQYVLRCWANDITIDGLYVDGNKSGQLEEPTVCDTISIGGERCVVKNCKLYNAIDSGVMFSDIKYGECTNNYIDGAEDLCIYVNGNNTNDNNGCFLVKENILRNAPYGGIALKRYTNKVIVTGNIIDHCGVGIAIEHFSGMHTEQFIITNNYIHNIGTFENNRGAGCAFRINMSDNILIANNIIKEWLNCAIGANYCTNLVISNNSFISINEEYYDPATAIPGTLLFGRYNAEDEYAIKDCIISNNVIDSRRWGAIKIHNNVPKNIINTVISGNCINTAGFCIEDRGVSGTYENCIITDNILNSDATYSFYVNGKKDYIFKNNKGNKGFVCSRKEDGLTVNRPDEDSEIPTGYQYYDHNLAKPIYRSASGYWRDTNGFSPTSNRGNTRPTGVAAGGVLDSNDIGFQFFDTTINKPIYVKAIAADGTVTWVDATGATV